MAPPTVGLQSHAAIALEWDNVDCSEGELTRWLQLAGDRVHSLCIRQPAGNMDLSAPVLRLLARPQLQSIRTLVLRVGMLEPTYLDQSAFSLIVKLPLLIRLDLHPMPSGGRHRDHWVALSRMPSLTALLVDDFEGQQRSLLGEVAKCTRLQRLCVGYPNLAGDAFAAFFSAPSIQQVVHLTFHRLRAKGLHPWGQPNWTPDYALFAGLKQLQSFGLSRCSDVDVILPHVPLIPRLVSMRIQSGYLANTIPSVGALNALLAASHPSLRVSLHFYLSPNGISDAEKRMLPQWRANVTPVALHSHRVILREPSDALLD